MRFGERHSQPHSCARRVQGHKPRSSARSIERPLVPQFTTRRYQTPFAVGVTPEAGLSDREVLKRADTLEYELAIVPTALARGDISVIREELDELMNDFQLSVDRKSQSYRKLGMSVLTAYVRALRDIERRNAGEPVETPPTAYVLPELPTGGQGSTLREAFEGWKKERERPEGTVHEYGRAVEMFVQLHGILFYSSQLGTQASSPY